jgi:hypothetical protein
VGLRLRDIDTLVFIERSLSSCSLLCLQNMRRTTLAQLHKQLHRPQQLPHMRCRLVDHILGVLPVNECNGDEILVLCISCHCY